MFVVLFFVINEIWNHRRYLRLTYIVVLPFLIIGFLTNGVQSFQLSVIGALLIWGVLWLIHTREVQTRFKTTAAGAFVLVLGIVTFIGAPLVMRFLTDVPPSSIGARVFLWSISLDAFISRPLIGIGLGNFEPLFDSLRPVIGTFTWSMEPREPHSLVFSLLAETGLLGTVLYVGFIFSGLKRGYSNIRVSEGTSTDNILFLALVGQLIMSMFGNLISALAIYLLIAMIGYRDSIIRDSSKTNYQKTNKQE
jgi:O-antigen ligase